MLVEKTREVALKAFLNGRKVRVVSEYDDGSVVVEKLEDMFPEEFHYLVDIPAYVNQEFEQSVKDMVESRFEVEDKNLAAGEIGYTTEVKSVTNHSRGCSVEDSSVYEKGESAGKKKKGFKTAYV